MDKWDILGIVALIGNAAGMILHGWLILTGDVTIGRVFLLGFNSFFAGVVLTVVAFRTRWD